MSSVHETFALLLKQAGYSVTTARKQVFAALLGKEPLSMHELVGLAAAIDRASVYRAVELFEQLGIVQRIHTGWKYKIELTDKFSAHHHHLSCLGCGRTTAMNERQLETLIETLSAQHGFTPSAHQIEIQGYCPTCTAKRQAQGRN